MNAFKQALNHFKNNWHYGLILGSAAAFIVLFSRHIPYISSFLMSAGLLSLQQIADQKIRGEKGKTLLTTKELTPFLVAAVVLFPTGVLLGSSMGILESPQPLHMTLPLSLGLFILSIYFYLVLSQALRLRLESKVNIAKAIDVVGLNSFKRFRLYLSLSFYLAILVMISGLTWGAGFIITLPLLFYVSYFSYLEVREQVISASSLPK